jgi:hypothetical protein
MNDRYSIRQHLNSILSLTEELDTAKLLVISIELDVDTAVDLIDHMTRFLVENIQKLIKPKSDIEFTIRKLELIVYDGDTPSLNYCFIVCGEFEISKYHLCQVIKKVIGGDGYCQFQIKKMNKSQIITELLPLHNGMTDIRVVNKLPVDIYNELINNDFELLSHCSNSKFYNQNNTILAGK